MQGIWKFQSRDHAPTTEPLEVLRAPLQVDSSTSNIKEGVLGNYRRA